MKILITGATGFIGEHVALRAMADGQSVRGLVRNPAKAARLASRGLEVVRGDVTDLASLRAAMQGIDVVVHLAAHVSEWGPWTTFQEVSVNGAENTLRAAADAGVARFLHASSAVVYEDKTARRLRVITEEAPHAGVGDRAYGFYAKAKVLAEQAAWRYQQQRKLAVTVVRPTWVYGPRDCTILPRLVEHLRSPLSCWVGNMNPVVDPIYVTDVANCMYLAATQDGAIGQAYNVAPEREICLREFLGVLCRELPLPLPRWSLPYRIAALGTAICEAGARVLRTKEPPPLTWAGLASFTVDQHLDPAKACRELGWRSAVALDEGARLTATWLKQQNVTRSTP